MRNEIGSFFEENEFGTEENQWLEELLGKRAALYTAAGREAIELAIMETECLHAGLRKVCLLPQYTCDTVIMPFQKHGWTIYFYPVDEKLAISQKILLEFLERIKPEILLMHTYFGVDTIGEVRELVKMYQEKCGLVFIEDMTQSLALLPQLRGADYYVGSLRKWFAIPDGGFLIGAKISCTESFKEKTAFVEKKVLAQRLKAAYLEGKEDISKAEFLRLNTEAENYLDQDDTISRISGFAFKKLCRMNGIEQLLKRNRNARILCQKVGACKKIDAIVTVEDQSPLYLPVLAENRQHLQQFLRERGIFAPVLWPIPRQIGKSLDRTVKYIFDHMLALPCDQRYTEQDMERIGEVLMIYDMLGES